MLGAKLRVKTDEVLAGLVLMRVRTKGPAWPAHVGKAF